MLAPNRLASLAAPLLLATLQLHCTSEDSFQCSSNAEDCGDSGLCEPTGFCSFDDPGCPSGRRYGDLAESLSNQCVPIEAGTGGSMSSTGTGLPQPSTGTTGNDPSGESSTSAAGLTTDAGSSTNFTTDATGTSATGSTTSAEDTTGGTGMCQLVTFDELPGEPDWFNFGDVSVESGQLVLNVSPPSGNLAGLRTATPLDMSEGSATAVLNELPALSVATASFDMVDEVFKTQNGYSIGVIDGVLRAERTADGGKPVIVDTALLDTADLPATMRFEVTGGTLSITVTGSQGEEPLLALSEDAPAWVDDLYVALNAGNPSAQDTMGELSIDSLELCPGFL